MMAKPQGERNERLTEPPSDLMLDMTFGFEIETYSSLWRWLSVADMAHVKCLSMAGVLDGDMATRLLGKLHSSHIEPMPPLKPALGDLYSNREVWLRERIGPLADEIATGRARREATTIAWHLETREKLENASSSIVSLVGSLLSAARTNRSALMPDFTYLQHAQPTTLGHYLLTFAFPLVRDLDRLSAAGRRVNLSPAGSGSVNGSRFRIDREELARLLGFDGLIRHNRDAMWAPDIALDPMWLTMSTFVTLDRLAEELQIWSTSEFGYFEPGDRHARTSVIMPQKKNPYGLAMIRGHARHTVGCLNSVIATNLTPTGQPDNRIIAYGGIPASLDRLAGAAQLLAEHLQWGSFDRTRLRSAAQAGFTGATEICDWLTLETGMSNRNAHSLIALAVRMAIERNGEAVEEDDIERAAAALSLDSPGLSEHLLSSLQDPLTVIGARVGIGSVADIDPMIDTLEARLALTQAPRFDGFEGEFLSMIERTINERSAP